MLVMLKRFRETLAFQREHKSLVEKAKLTGNFYIHKNGVVGSKGLVLLFEESPLGLRATNPGNNVQRICKDTEELLAFAQEQHNLYH